MKRLKWITISYYVDEETGEQLTKHIAKTLYIVKEKVIINQKTKYDTFYKKVVGLHGYDGIKTITNICVRDRQIKLAFD